MAVPNTKPEGKPNALQETGDDLGLSPSADWGLRALLMVLLVWLGWSHRAGNTADTADTEDTADTVEDNDPANDGISSADDDIDAPPLTRPIPAPMAPLVTPLARKRQPAPSAERPPLLPDPEFGSLATTHLATLKGPPRTIVSSEAGPEPEPDPTMKLAAQPATEHKPSRRATTTTAGLTPNQQWLATATALGAVVAYRAGRRTQRPR